MTVSDAKNIRFTEFKLFFSKIAVRFTFPKGGKGDRLSGG